MCSHTRRMSPFGQHGVLRTWEISGALGADELKQLRSTVDGSRPGLEAEVLEILVTPTFVEFLAQRECWSSFERCSPLKASKAWAVKGLSFGVEAV